MIDQLMIGQLGEQAIAAVGLASRPQWILLFIVMGIAGGASIFIAQYWGRGDRSQIPQVMGIAFAAGGVFIVLFALLSLVTPRAVLSLFTTDRCVIEAGSPYLAIISAGYLPLLLINVYSAVLRSTGHTRLPLYAGLVSVLLNTGLNYLLIFGKAGLPELGVNGAALATSAARITEALIILSVVYRKKLPGAVRPGKMFRFQPDFLRRFVATTVPLVMTEFIWVVGDSLFSVIYGRMGTVSLAAVTLTQPVQNLTVGFFTGLSTAAAVMLGNELGAERFNRAGSYARRYLRLGLMLTILLGGAVIALSSVYVRLFNVPPEVRESARLVMNIFGGFLWIKVLNMTIGNGILRSGGDTRFVLTTDTLGMWGLGIPAGFLAAFIFGLPVHMVYLVICLEEAVRLGLGVLRIRSGKWLRNLTDGEPEPI